MATALPSARWMWLPPTATALMIGPIYLVTADAERGSRAGAEPVIAGSLSSLPFILLLGIQVVAAAFAMGEHRRAVVKRCLVTATAAAAVVAVLILTIKLRHVMQGYPWAAGAPGIAVLAAALTLPLVPAWAKHLARTPTPDA